MNWNDALHAQTFWGGKKSSLISRSHLLSSLWPTEWLLAKGRFHCAAASFTSAHWKRYTRCCRPSTAACKHRHNVLHPAVKCGSLKERIVPCPRAHIFFSFLSSPNWGGCLIAWKGEKDKSGLWRWLERTQGLRLLRFDSWEGSRSNKWCFLRYRLSTLARWLTEESRRQIKNCES